MKTKNYYKKRLAFLFFGPKYYHTIKSKKILFDYLMGRDYSMIKSQLRFILKEDDVVFDVGANMGQYLLRLSKIVRSGTIVSVEPIPENLKALHYAVHLLRIPNCKIIPKAVSEKVGVSRMIIPKINKIPISTQATLKNIDLRENDVEQVEVETTTLDILFEDLKLRTVDFIKVDTEGHDSIALASGKKMIHAFRPLIRLEENVFDGSFTWLFDLGYRAFAIVNGHTRMIETPAFAEGVEGDLFLATKDRLETICVKFPLVA